MESENDLQPSMNRVQVYISSPIFRSDHNDKYDDNDDSNNNGDDVDDDVDGIKDVLCMKIHISL